MAAVISPKVPEARAIAKNLRIAPRKVRIVIDLIRGKSVEEALQTLRFIPKRAAKAVEKVVRSAAANAVNNYDMNEDRLYIAEIYADEGMVMKRYRPRARGQAFPIMRRTSHVTVVVRERKEG